MSVEIDSVDHRFPSDNCTGPADIIDAILKSESPDIDDSLLDDLLAETVGKAPYKCSLDITDVGFDVKKDFTLLSATQLAGCKKQQWSSVSICANEYSEAPYDDIWNSGYVRMPCSSHCLYPVVESDSKLTKRWDLIKASFSRKPSNVQELIKAISAYNRIHMRDVEWDFQSLQLYFSQFLNEHEYRMSFQNLIPKILATALKLPQLLPKTPFLLQRQQSGKLVFTHEQLSCILCNAFLCTWPRRNVNKAKSEFQSYPTINFNRLFSSKGRRDTMFEKLSCMFNYFQKALSSSAQSGLVCFERRVVHPANFPQWNIVDTKITSRLVVHEDGKIEDAVGFSHVDFANKRIGGGVLGGGAVQEEIMFLMAPELIAARLFTEELARNEALVISGALPFNSYFGYGSTFGWNGNYKGELERFENGFANTQIIAIDATHFPPGLQRLTQFQPKVIERELNKCFVGFSSHSSEVFSKDTEKGPLDRYMSSGEPFCKNSKMEDACNAPNLCCSAIATGNWGCGAFGGDVHLKSVIQLMVASVCRRELIYYTFGDADFSHQLKGIHSLMKEKTVGWVMVALEKYWSVEVAPLWRNTSEIGRLTREEISLAFGKMKSLFAFLEEEALA